MLRRPPVSVPTQGMNILICREDPVVLDAPDIHKHRVRFHISSAPTAQRVRRAYAPYRAGEVFFWGKGRTQKQKAESGSRRTRFRLNNGQTWAVNGRLELAGDTAGLPKSP